MAKLKKRAIQKKANTAGVITTWAAAAHCGVSVPTLKRWIRGGELAAFTTPGGHFRIDLDDFQRFLGARGIAPYPVPVEPTRIMIADDAPEVVDLLVAFLASDPRGFTVDTATDGYEALIKVGAFRPAVLVLDAVMPRLDGVEVCRRLRATPETQGVRILGLTGYPEMIPRLLEAGAHACLGKPVSLAEFQAALDRFLERGRAGTAVAARPRAASPATQGRGAR